MSNLPEMRWLSEEAREALQQELQRQTRDPWSVAAVNYAFMVVVALLIAFVIAVPLCEAFK